MQQMRDEDEPMEYDLVEVIRQASIYLTVALILTFLTGLIPTGLRVEDGTSRGGSIVYSGRPFGWVLSVDEMREYYVELDLGFFLLNLLIYTMLSIVIVEYRRKRRGNTHS